MNALRAEWIKLRTLLANKIMWLVAVAFPVVVSVLTAGFSNDVFDSIDAAEIITGLTVVTALIFAVMGVVSITGEYAHGTIRPTFAAQPRRWSPLVAKTLVVVSVAAVTTVLVLALSWALFTTVADDAENEFAAALGAERWPFWSFQGERLLPPAMFAGLLVMTVGLVLVGLGVGMLVRNIGGAVAIVLLWPWLVENLLAAMLENVFDMQDAQKWMPMQQGFSLFLVDRFDFDRTRVGSGVYFMIFMVAVYLLGVIRTIRSDA